MSEVRLGGPVVLDPTAFVAPGALVAGDVRLARGASVWFNTVVRGDSAPVEIGEDTNVQDNSVVHEDEGLPAILGARVTVGHRAIIHGCVIEDDCLIGMGAVVLSGARIGTGSLVGAGALIKEGQVIPPGSLAVGMPARVVGATTDVHRRAIRNGATHYAALARAYLASGMARPVDTRGRVSPHHREMTRHEWEALVRELAALPSDVERHLPRASGAAHAAEVLGRLRDADRTQRRPCLEALLSGAAHTLPARPHPAAAAHGDPAAALAEWTTERAALVRMLAGLGPSDWNRVAGHPTRGPFSLADLVREWREEDLERRAALAAGGTR